jgi:hypothetical protein
MSPVRARVRFLAAAEGGRSRPPAGPRYSTTVRVAGDPDPTPHWTMLMEFESGPDEAGEVVARVQFLAEESPYALLLERGSFDVFEGPHLVARGVLHPQVTWWSSVTRAMHPPPDHAVIR